MGCVVRASAQEYEPAAPAPESPADVSPPTSNDQPLCTASDAPLCAAPAEAPAGDADSAPLSQVQTPSAGSVPTASSNEASPPAVGASAAPATTMEEARDPLDRADDALSISAPTPPTLQGRRFANVWERIRSGFKMPPVDDALVRKWEAFYAARPEYWQRINERGRRYLYFIAREIERRGMPLEIALLPVIESAYNPQALSTARALGIWQFIPETGKTYGLAQNWWMDARRDVSVATTGALDYLGKLHEMFGDWQLALAAYNWGENAVQRAVNRNRAAGMPTDYASLKIPTETRNYLPKLQAVKNIVLDPDRFGLSLPEVADASYFVTVTTERQIDVALAAKLADMPLDDFRLLNPAHNRPVIASRGAQRINLPSDKAETFVMNLDSYRQPLLSWRPYQIKSGDKIEKIAPEFGIGVDELKRVNGLTGRKRIGPGFTLLVPVRYGVPPDAIATEAFREAPVDGPSVHRVRRGETLARIAERYGVSVADLKRLNGLATTSVSPGRRLRLHEGTTLAPSAKASGKARSVKATGKKKVKATRRRA